MMDFAESFKQFLADTDIEFRSAGNSFYLPSADLTVVLVPLEESSVALAGPAAATSGTIHVFEDRWWGKGELIRARLKAHTGRQRSIFARKCEVVKPSPQEAAAFLDANHIYGSARCRYRYGLKYGGAFVAVSTFSAPRPLPRIVRGEERIVESYEWVRFASLPDCRISGGMSRLLKAFIEDVHPDDIMSYADLEWSDGAVYETLGFSRTAIVPPVQFAVNTSTWERISIKKITSDRSLRGIALPSDAVVISNLGSAKYLLTLV